MKKILLILMVFSLISACGNDDNGGATTRGPEKIEVTIDGASVPDTYSQNIITMDLPLDPSSGFTNIFTISSQSVSSENFKLNFGPSTISPFTVITPSSETKNGPISLFLEIDGITIDDAAANVLNIDYLQFGTNTGDAIEIEINGTYFEQNSTIPHTIKVMVNIERD